MIEDNQIHAIVFISGKKDFMAAAKDSFISSTTHTESIGFAAMSAVLDYYNKNNVSQSLGEKGASIKKILIKVVDKYGIQIKISGMDQLWSWSFDMDAEENRKYQTIITEQMLKRSILFSNRFYLYVYYN